MTAASRRTSKDSALRRHHAFNRRPQSVNDPAFTSGNPFFDARDLVQVKYEMLRRVESDGETVSHAATGFGFSRPSYYEAKAVFKAAGLPGLLPQRPGPKRAHKLSGEVLVHLEAAMAADSSLNSAQLAQLLKDQLGIQVHRRSVERAIARRRKKGAPTTS